jgi:hypothetical protein
VKDLEENAMKKILINLFVLSLTFLVGLGLDSIHPNTIAKNEVLQLIDEFHNAEVNGDGEKLRLILADEIQSKVRNGEVETVSSNKFVKFINELELDSIWTGFYFTEIQGDEIIVHFFMAIKFEDRNKDSFDHLGSYSYAFGKDGKHWKLNSIHFKNHL